MSSSNDGISRFVESTVYAPVTFKGAVVLDNVSSLDAGDVPLVLTSNHSIKFAGLLEQQDITVAGDTIMSGANFLQHINVTAGATITLPDLKADGTFGVPNGMRMTFYNVNATNLTFKTSLASGAVIHDNRTVYVAQDVTQIIPEQVAADTATDPYTQYSFVYVTSADTFWVINGTIPIIVPP